MALTRPALAALLLLVLAVPTGANGAEPVRATPQIVLYADGVANPSGATRAREHELGFSATQRYRHAIAGFAAPLTQRQVARLAADPAVAAVVPDLPVHADSVPVTAGETVPVGLTRIGVASGGFVHGAADAALAVLDSGVDLGNAELNVEPGTNCVHPGTPPMDDNGHGTHVAGTIGARNSGSGVVGVAPGTKLYAVKVLGANGGGSTSDVICGIEWVTAHAQSLGIRVANMSLGAAGAIGSCARDPEHSAICALVAAGVTPVAAAGNNGDPISANGRGHVPAAYPEVLAVTAMVDTDGVPGGLGAKCSGMSDDRQETFSNYAGPDDGAHTVAAPGGCILSTKLGGGTVEMSGTSMAAPYVAGFVALCLGDSGVPGPCAEATPAAVVAAVRASAQAAAESGSGYLGDPLHPGVHTYGYLVRYGTPPRAVTGSAAAVEDHAVLLDGSLAGLEDGASWWFEIGPTAGVYDRTTDAQVLDAGSD